tara:strand:+ start:91 stop:219 length:129 start_codon:yes stop_codon:yes gene_type:complete
MENTVFECIKCKNRYVYWWADPSKDEVICKFCTKNFDEEEEI